MLSEAATRQQVENSALRVPKKGVAPVTASKPMLLDGEGIQEKRRTGTRQRIEEKPE
jgi:hypothetical protein